jgi:NAD+-dependent protein deacetylase sirtuin 6
MDYIRESSVASVGFKYTGRQCDECNGALRDCTLDWDDALPERALKWAQVCATVQANNNITACWSASSEMRPVQHHTKMADLCICMGSSLQVRPASTLPLLCKRTYASGNKTERGKLVIINLQKTHRDKDAHLVIHGVCQTERALARVVQGQRALTECWWLGGYSTSTR